MNIQHHRVFVRVLAVAVVLCVQAAPGLCSDVRLSRQQPTAAACFAAAYVNARGLGANYDQFMPVIGSHCQGTNHQSIAGIERVVFLGDSITVGTPPTQPDMYYRSQLAAALVTQFGLSYDFLEELWQLVNPTDGVTLVREAGDFASCARWGARNKDLLPDDAQLEACFPPDKRHQRTLVIMTSGGNDIANLTRNAIDGATEEALWVQTMDFVQRHRDAIDWLVGDPARFPRGIFVIFANLYEFTDGTGDVQACDGAAAAGFNQPVPRLDQLLAKFIWANEQYLKTAVETGTDMIFMSEAFCGRGFQHADPTSPCYRGPETELWFDLTCIHPNPMGHTELANMFLSVVNAAAVGIPTLAR